MSLLPPKQNVLQGDVKYCPSSDAVYNFVSGLTIGPAFPYYGSFYDTTTQTNSPNNTPRAMTFNSISGNYHVSIQNNSRITFDYSGTYNIQYYYNALNHNNNNFSIVAQLSNSTRGIIYYDSNAGANITTTYIAKSGITSVFSTQNYTFTLQVISQTGNTVTLSNACVVISKLPI